MKVDPRDYTKRRALHIGRSGNRRLGDPRLPVRLKVAFAVEIGCQRFLGSFKYQVAILALP